MQKRGVLSFFVTNTIGEADIAWAVLTACMVSIGWSSGFGTLSPYALLRMRLIISVVYPSCRFIFDTVSTWWSRSSCTAPFQTLRALNLVCYYGGYSSGNIGNNGFSCQSAYEISSDIELIHVLVTTLNQPISNRATVGLLINLVQCVQTKPSSFIIYCSWSLTEMTHAEEFDTKSTITRRWTTHSSHQTHFVHVKRLFRYNVHQTSCGHGSSASKAIAVSQNGPDRSIL